MSKFYPRSQRTTKLRKNKKPIDFRSVFPAGDRVKYKFTQNAVQSYTTLLGSEESDRIAGMGIPVSQLFRSLIDSTAASTLNEDMLYMNQSGPQVNALVRTFQGFDVLVRERTATFTAARYNFCLVTGAKFSVSVQLVGGPNNGNLPLTLFMCPMSSPQFYAMAAFGGRPFDRYPPGVDVDQQWNALKLQTMLKYKTKNMNPTFGHTIHLSQFVSPKKFCPPGWPAANNTPNDYNHTYYNWLAPNTPRNPTMSDDCIMYWGIYIPDSYYAADGLSEDPVILNFTYKWTVYLTCFQPLNSAFNLGGGPSNPGEIQTGSSGITGLTGEIVLESKRKRKRGPRGVS